MAKITINNFDESKNLDELEAFTADDFLKEINTQFYIPTQNAMALKKRLEKANRRAHKCLVSAGLRKKDDEKIPVIELEIMGLDEKENEEGEMVPCFVVQLSGDLPKMECEEFVARVEHIMDEEQKRWENLIHRVPGTIQEINLVSYRHAAPCCEHCRTERRRIDTFLIRNQGVLKQIGRNCLADYLGGMSYKMFEELADILIDISDACEDLSRDDGSWSDWGYHSSRMVNLEEYLSWVALMIRKQGWVSKQVAREEGKPSTADCAIAMMNDYHRGQKDDIPSGQETKKIEEALAWIRGVTEEEIVKQKDDYLYNLQTICKREYLRYQNHGIAGSLFAAYARAMREKEKEEKRQTEPQLPSVHVGTVGERIVINAKVLQAYENNDGFNGPYVSYYMKDETTGNLFKWCSSNAILQKDETYTLKTTIKKHEETKDGTPRTVITRAVVLNK